MTQAQLERAICRATGESRDLIHRMGFGLLITPPPGHYVRRRRRYHRRAGGAANRSPRHNHVSLSA